MVLCRCCVKIGVGKMGGGSVDSYAKQMQGHASPTAGEQVCRTTLFRLHEHTMI